MLADNMPRDDKDIAIGVCRGRVSPDHVTHSVMSALERLPALLASEAAHTLSAGRNRNILIDIGDRDRPLDVVVKSFGRQPAWKDRIDLTRRGSKARRTWLAANALRDAGVGTPMPVAFLEHVEDGRIHESYFVAVYERDALSFKDELIRLFENNPECEHFMALLQTVADAVRAMHTAGFQHNDLGNQNILLDRTGEAAWGNVRFIDLNRARFGGLLDDRQRARDISRIYLPSDLLRVFREMYCADVPSPAFLAWERRFRSRFAFHTRTRKYRHPIRTWRARHLAPREAAYPDERDMWIWDERSAQAISLLTSRDRRRRYRGSWLWRSVGTALRALPAARREYHRLLRRAYHQPVDMAGTVSVALEPRPETFEQELAHLAELGQVPVLVRLYHHESESRFAFRLDAIRRLHELGHRTAVALVQDRAAVKAPDRWRAFADTALAAVSETATWVEVAHAINRVKWGIWDARDYARVVREIESLRATYPTVRFVGPAVIDFEYQYVTAALSVLGKDTRWHALSHHLYVDRRGPPEAPQAGFAALEKFALARAIARQSPRTDDRLIVSEVNWPLKGAGVYSPVGSPYESPGVRTGDPSVDEDTYADYMIRYLVIAICSGFVEQVVWWRLAAHGFGLIDDRVATGWRHRPAFTALRQFLRKLGPATFLRKLPAPDGVHLFLFRVDRHDRVLAYADKATQEFEAPFPIEHAEDAVGRPVTIRNGRVALSGRPVYLESSTAAPDQE